MSHNKDTPPYRTPPNFFCFPQPKRAKRELKKSPSKTGNCEKCPFQNYKKGEKKCTSVATPYNAMQINKLRWYTLFFESVANFQSVASKV